MKVQCSGCQSNYNFNDEKIPAKGANIKCPKCQKIIEVAKPAIIQDIPVPLSPPKKITKTDRAKSKLRQNPERNAPKIWAIMSATVVGIAVLCLALGVPIKNDKKTDRKGIPEIVMPFNFADDKFAEFKYFIETIEQKWRTHPADLLNFQEYPAPDEYGHSQYGVEEHDLFVEFFFFFNQLYQSTISTQDSAEAKRWVEYLDSTFGEKVTDGGFYTWRKVDLNIAYAFESNQYIFHFIHTETFAERQEYRTQYGSDLVKFEVFKKIIDNKMNWAVTTDNFPGMSLHQKTDVYKWSEYYDDNATNLYYKFFRDSLCRVDILVLDSEQATKMQEILESQYGEGEINPDESIKWIADGITITSFNYLKGRGFAFTHNETLKAKEEYAKNLKKPQKKIAFKKKRNKETIRNDKVEDSLKRIAGQNRQKARRKKVSGTPKMSRTTGQKRVSVASSNNCWAERSECLHHCDQADKSNSGPRTKMYKGEVRTCSAVCYEGYRDCLEI